MKSLILIAFVLTSNIYLVMTGGDTIKCVFLGKVTKIKSTQIGGAKYEITVAVDSIINKVSSEKYNDPFYERRNKELFATIYTSRSLDGCETNNCSTCGYPFELDKNYIFYINENSHGIHIVNGCSKTKLITKTENYIDKNLETKKIKGELYFKLISFGSFYDVPDSTINKFESTIDSLYSQKKISKQDQKLLGVIKTLKQYNLMKKPFFNLKIDSAQILTVYVSEKEYEKVKQFDRQKLINENKKVDISLKGRLIEENIIDCYEILSTKKVDGNTYWRK